MIAVIIDFVFNSSLVQALLAGLAGLVLLWGYGAKQRRKGAEEQKAKQRQAQQQADSETRKRIDETPSNGGDRNVALDRLRSREARNKPKGGV